MADPRHPYFFLVFLILKLSLSASASKTEAPMLFLSSQGSSDQKSYFVQLLSSQATNFLSWAAPLRGEDRFSTSFVISLLKTDNSLSTDTVKHMILISMIMHDFRFASRLLTSVRSGDLISFYSASSTSLIRRILTLFSFGM